MRYTYKFSGTSKQRRKMNTLRESRWLNVLGPIEQGIITIQKNISFADVSGDQDYKLIIGDLGFTSSKPKLKIFKGVTIINEIQLPNLPSGVVSFNTTDSIKRSPIIAVSLGFCIYMYKNMKIFYKLFLPQLEVQPLEINTWRELCNGVSRGVTDFDDSLKKLNVIPYEDLSPQSQHLLALPKEQHVSFIRENTENPLHKTSVITCLATLNINSIEPEAVACLVLGTENGDILILEPQAFSIIHQARINSTKMTPVFIETVGLYDVDYKLFISTRENTICILKREWLEGKCIIQLQYSICGILIMPGDNSIALACMDKTLQYYTKKGKKKWSLVMPDFITTISIVKLSHLGVNFIAVSMFGGLIHFYNGKNLVDVIRIQDTASVVKFGQIGQEENVLVLITVDGALSMKILKRTADFNLSNVGLNQKAHPSLLANQQSKPLLVPKKSKLFIEQATREREQSTEMHNTFQKELCNLRLYVARTTIEAMKKANSSLISNTLEPLKLISQVQGLGPVFKVILTLESLAQDKPIGNLSLVITCDHRYFKINPQIMKVSLLVFGVPQVYIIRVSDLFFVEEINENEYYDESEFNNKRFVKIILVKENQTQPLLCAPISIPNTDPLMTPFEL